MKSTMWLLMVLIINVTPCVGVWIEIIMGAVKNGTLSVTPCVGVWIEILVGCSACFPVHVTPCVGVWIEINMGKAIVVGQKGHSLRGSVD